MSFDPLSPNLFTAAPRLWINDVQVPALMSAMTGFVVQQALDLPAQCEIWLGGMAMQSMVDDVLAAVPVGAQLALDDGSTLVFRGHVTALDYRVQADAPPMIAVRAYDALHRLRRQHPYRIWQDVNTADVAQSLAAAVDLSADVEGGGAQWPYLIQVENDLDFLVSLAQRAGLHLSAHDDRLHLIALDPTQLPDTDMLLVVGQSLLEADFSLSAEPATRRADAAGWHPRDVVARTGSASAGDLDDVYERVEPGLLNLDGLTRLSDETAVSKGHADDLGQMALRSAIARERVIEGVAIGDARLRPGAAIEISGAAAPFSGRYRITQATHIRDAQQGYRTHFSSAPPPLRPRDRAAVVTLGIVSRVDDGGRGRVRVTLPTYGDLETDWLPVVVAGAGNGRGLLVLPDRGDTVLLVLAHGDPSQGLVLGGLYGRHATPRGATRGNSTAAYVLTTAGGQQIMLDDRQGVITLQNRDGSRLELSPRGVSLRADARLDIDAGGHPIRIRGGRIDFEQG